MAEVRANEFLDRFLNGEFTKDKFYNCVLRQSFGRARINKIIFPDNIAVNPPGRPYESREFEFLIENVEWELFTFSSKVLKIASKEGNFDLQSAGVKLYPQGRMIVLISMHARKLLPPIEFSSIKIQEGETWKKIVDRSGMLTKGAR